MLEPSLAAFSLDEKKDSAGRRYVGNSFGIPHRDYAHPELFPCPRRAGVTFPNCGRSVLGCIEAEIFFKIA